MFYIYTPAGHHTGGWHGTWHVVQDNLSYFAEFIDRHGFATLHHLRQNGILAQVLCKLFNFLFNPSLPGQVSPAIC